MLLKFNTAYFKVKKEEIYFFVFKGEKALFLHSYPWLFYYNVKFIFNFTTFDTK